MSANTTGNQINLNYPLAKWYITTLLQRFRMIDCVRHNENVNFTVMQSSEYEIKYLISVTVIGLSPQLCVYCHFHACDMIRRRCASMRGWWGRHGLCSSSGCPPPPHGSPPPDSARSQPGSDPHASAGHPPPPLPLDNTSQQPHLHTKQLLSL